MSACVPAYRCGERVDVGLHVGAPREMSSDSVQPVDEEAEVEVPRRGDGAGERLQLARAPPATSPRSQAPIAAKNPAKNSRSTSPDARAMRPTSAARSARRRERRRVPQRRGSSATSTLPMSSGRRSGGRGRAASSSNATRRSRSSSKVRCAARVERIRARRGSVAVDERERVLAQLDEPGVRASAGSRRTSPARRWRSRLRRRRRRRAAGGRAVRPPRSPRCSRSGPRARRARPRPSHARRHGRQVAAPGCRR